MINDWTDSTLKPSLHVLIVSNVAIEMRVRNCESIPNQRTFLKADPRKHLLDGLWPLDVAHRRRPPLRPPPPPPRTVSGRSSAAAATAASDRVLFVNGEHVVRGFLGEDFDVDELEVTDAGRTLALPEAARIHGYYLEEVAALKW